MNPSFQSPQPEVDMVSLLYDSATDGIYTKLQVILYVDMSGFFLPICPHEKKISTTPLAHAIMHFKCSQYEAKGILQINNTLP